MDLSRALPLLLVFVNALLSALTASWFSTCVGFNWRRSVSMRLCMQDQDYFCKCGPSYRGGNTRARAQIFSSSSWLLALFDDSSSRSISLVASIDFMYKSHAAK